MEESLKIARGAVASVAIEIAWAKMDLSLGKNEIAIVKAIHRYRNVGVAAKSIIHGLYRKSDMQSSNIADPDAVSRDKNWLLWEMHDTGVAGYVGSIMSSNMYYFDDLILIRSPQTVMKNLAANYALVVETLYYKSKIVSDKDYAQLMMKYHS